MREEQNFKYLCFGILLVINIEAADLPVVSPSCGFPGLPANSLVSPNNQGEFYTGDFVSYSCQTGFAMFGPASRECEDGTWSISRPVCRENIALGQPATQSDTLWDFSPGLAVDGDLNTTCSFTPRTLDQRWWQVQLTSSVNVEAIAVAMNSDTLQHFTIFVIELLEGSKALYKPCSKFEGFFDEPRAVFLCNDGKGHIGGFVYIRDDREEQEYLGICEVQVFPFRNTTDCGYPEQPLGGVVVLDAGLAHYNCEGGYVLLGEGTRYCQQNGEWSGAPPGCAEVECPDPVSPASGYIEVSNFNGRYQFGAVASYRCNLGYILWGNSSSLCGRDGSWQGSPSSCRLITCGAPPHVDNTMVELVNGSTSWQSLIAYQCKAGYYEAREGSAQQFSISVSECQADGNWSPVHLSCSFDPAAVARNMQRGHIVDWEEKEGMNLATVVSVVVISAVIIMSLIIGFIVVNHKQKNAADRATKLSRLNGVKVLPGQVIRREVDDYMERKLGDLQINEVEKLDEDGHQEIMTKYSTKNTLYHKTSPNSLSSPSPNFEEHSQNNTDCENLNFKKEKDNEIYASIGPRRRSTRIQASDHDFDPYESVKCKSDPMTEVSKEKTDNSCDSEESKKQSYESHGKCKDKNDIPETKHMTNSCDLYAKVKKMSSVSDGPNLNSDFVSIYEVTKVESNTTPINETVPTSERIDKNKQKHISLLKKTPCEQNVNNNCTLKFKTNKQSSSRLSDRNEKDNTFEPYEDDNSDSVESIAEDNADISERFDTMNRQNYVQNDPIPKMNINMFIQKDAKQNVRSWPKVETKPFHSKPKDSTPTKHLISRFNNGLNKASEVRPGPNKIKSPTKLLINKFNNPNEINNKPASSGFHGIKPIISNSSNQYEPTFQATTQNAFKSQSINLWQKSSNPSPIQMPNRKSPVHLPRPSQHVKPSQVHKLVNAMNKPTNQRSAWQAADI